ncbi:MAG: hypothetical protein CL525_07685 [Aequorivita sp.]|mgnify:FL=1|nr:hypothetical protein [Aequorivita sp.]
MKVLNNINIDFDSNNNRVYELSIVCNNESEIDTAFEKLSNTFVVDNFEDNDVTVIAEAWKYSTKQDFIKKVRSLLK